MTEIVCACVCACVRVCVHACVRVCVRACMCQYRCVPDSTLLLYHDQDAKSSYTVMIDSHIVLLCMYTVTVSYVYNTKTT